MQGSAEWLRKRMGKITCSELHKLMSPNIVTRNSYLEKLNEEKVLLIEGISDEELLNRSVANDAMKWGTFHEDEARAFYELRHDVDITVPDFLEHPILKGFGYSTDGLVVGDAGQIEVKCPYNQSVHANTIVHGMPDKHRDQVQGGMSITGAIWTDFVSYDPRQASRKFFEQRIYRDDSYISLIEERVQEALTHLENGTLFGDSEAVPRLF